MCFSPSEGKKSPRVGLVVKREASASVAGVQQLIGTFTENQEKQSWSPGEGKRNKKEKILRWTKSVNIIFLTVICTCNP